MKKYLILTAIFIFFFLSGLFTKPVSAQPPQPCTFCTSNDDCIPYQCDSGTGCCGTGGGCFTGDTPIRMADETEKPIEKVEVGEMVKSFNAETGEVMESKVEKVYEHSKEEVKGYYILTTESGRQVKVTPEHPILAMKTSETMSPLELSLLKTKAALLSAARKLQGLLF